MVAIERPRRTLAVALVVLVVVVALALFAGDVAEAVKSGLERLTELPGPALVAAVGILAMLETAAFAGLAVPGELAVVLGGVASYEGKAPVQLMAAAAVTGAIAGDSLGFYFGRRLGTKVLDGKIGRLMGKSRVESTMGRIRAGGIKAVILGRFVGVLRAIMPFAAGASGMAYRRFVVASVLGASAWGIGFTLAGYFAGNSWRRVEGYAGQASKLLAIVVGVIVVLVIASKQAIARQERIRAAWSRVMERPRIRSLRLRYHRQLRFLLGRFRPGTAAGLQLTVSLVGLALLGYALAVVISQVLGSGGLVDADESVRRTMAEARTEQGRDVMTVLRNVLSPKGAWAMTALVGGWLWAVDRRPRALVLLLAAVGGAAVLTEAVQGVIGRAEVLLSFDTEVITEFPSRHMTMVVACIYALLAVLLPRTRRWPLLVAAVAVALGLVLLAGLAVLYLERVLFSDAVGGAALGALWGLAVATAVATVWRPRKAPTAEVHSS